MHINVNAQLKAYLPQLPLPNIIGYWTLQHVWISTNSQDMSKRQEKNTL